MVRKTFSTVIFQLTSWRLIFAADDNFGRTAAAAAAAGNDLFGKIDFFRDPQLLL